MVPVRQASDRGPSAPTPVRARGADPEQRVVEGFPAALPQVRSHPRIRQLNWMMTALPAGTVTLAAPWRTRTGVDCGVANAPCGPTC